MAEAITAGVGLITMLFLAPLIALMPQATLAAIVIVYSIGLIKPAEFRAILRVRRTEFVWALAALAGVVLLGLEGRMFFANAERIAEKIGPLIEEAKPKVVALDLSGVFDLEYTALKMLTEREKREREHGVLLWLVGLNPDVLAAVQGSPLGEVLGRERMHFNLEVAVAKYLTAKLS